ncbi:hypothetical protein ACEYW6_35815, partial [Nostoc sp. UIC 10607]|uniref:hypothetical protein n=1 Tax=Nostoc sp. UIC 10607 TaxID=3045935 RepID=UPI0039A3D38E
MSHTGFGKIASPQKSLNRELRQVFRKFNKRGNHRYESSAIAEFKKSKYAPTDTGNSATGQSITPRNQKVQTCPKENIHKADSIGNEQTASIRILESASQPGESCRGGSGFEGIEGQHYQEFINSAINPEIAALNFKSLSGAGYDYLLYSPKISRRNDGRIRDGDMRRYAHLADGGWWCSGINIITGEDSDWGCFKPNTPRIDEGNS